MKWLRTRCAACGTRVGEDSTRCPECKADHRPIKRITIHGLRHTHGTLLLLAGVPLHVASRRLGHANEAFTARVYGHVLPQQAADAAARFAALVDEAGESEARQDEEG